MIPISDDPGPRRRFPFVNYALILINIAVFIAELVNGQCFQFAYSTIPYAITHNTEFALQGCPYGQPQPVYITLLTSMFLHANLLHIAGNMLYLWIFGDNVEDRLGHVGYLIFYLFCGFVASAAQILVDPNSQLINLGASGAIAGVLGAYLIFYPGAKVRSLIFLGIFITFRDVAIAGGHWPVVRAATGVGPAEPQSATDRWRRCRLLRARRRIRRGAADRADPAGVPQAAREAKHHHISVMANAPDYRGY